MVRKLDKRCAARRSSASPAVKPAGYAGEHAVDGYVTSTKAQQTRAQCQVRQRFALCLRQLRAIREKQLGRPLSQHAFGLMLSLSGPQYASYERAAREPTLATLVALRRLTGASLDEFLQDPERAAAQMGGKRQSRKLACSAA